MHMAHLASTHLSIINFFDVKSADKYVEKEVTPFTQTQISEGAHYSIIPPSLTKDMAMHCFMPSLDKRKTIGFVYPPRDNGHAGDDLRRGRSVESVVGNATTTRGSDTARIRI
jgi:hypothetical protein